VHFRRGLAILLVLLTTALVALLGGQSASPSRPGPGKTAVFVQDPYMGVACHTPNSIACDRIGLAVWLARPATVSATIAGTSFRLDDPAWTYVTRAGGKPLYVYAGFLQPARLTTRLHVAPSGGATWLGAHNPNPAVGFRIDYRDGGVVIARQHVWLHAGWG
jgi:hypothetical protein